VTQQKEQGSGAFERPLKVVHLATTDFGGAGKAAYRLHKGLQASGVDSTMLVVNRKNIDPSVRILPSGQVGGIIDCPEQYPPNLDYAHRIWQHWTAMVSSYPDRAPGMEIFSDDFSEIPLECSREIREADIVNLHWVAGLLNCVNAALALKGKKVVWTMHDMNPVTGGCHYAGTCEGYLKSCGSCPMLGSRSDEDLSRTIWQFKQYAYGKLDLHPVSPSRWLARVASQSTLLSPFRTRVIPNGCPADVFTPSPRRDEVRRGYGVPEGSKVVLFGAESLLTERKGFIYLLRALKGMATDGVVFAFFGKLPQEVQLALELPLINLGFVEDESTLAALYSMADLFVIPSVEDNLPNTVVEAMLCGVPVVGFDIGGIPDMVEHKKTGYLVPPRDVAALVDGINWCLFHPDAAGLGAASRKKALACYSLEAQAAGYTALYRELLAPSPEKNAVAAKTPETFAVAARPVAARLSLVIPSYNYGRYLGDCLDSILSQNYPNLELIVMDGGSTDHSPEILKRHQKHLAYWQSRPDAGQYSAIEEGFKRSTGELMAWLNADDMFHPEAFETVSGIFSQSPEIEWLMGRPNSFDEAGRQKVGLSFLPMNSRAKYLADQELIQQEGIFWRRSLWERSGSFLEKELLLAADLELWARFFRSAQLYSVDTLIAGFRDHPLQKSKDKAGYTAEANRVLARERELFAAEAKRFNPPAPLPILVGESGGRP
jgi:glycosyltransferase involved in cell wall biosynthesis